MSDTTLSMLNVGFVDYLNAFPLNGAFRIGAIESNCILLSFHVPSQLNLMLRNGRLDLSQVSSLEYLERGYALLPGLGISARSKILSVNLYLKKEPKDLQGARIGITTQSSTSAALLKVICHHFWKVSPSFEPLDRTRHETEYDGILLIGDEALEKETIPHFFTIDLAETWVQFTSLPFVFAVFAVRKEVWETKKEEVDAFSRKLNAALNWAENNSDEVLKLAQKRSSTPLSRIKDYYSLCHYRLGKQEMEGLFLFQKLIRTMN